MTRSDLRQRDIPWGMVPVRALTLPSPAIRLFTVLSSHANETRLAYPSQDRLAEELDWYWGAPLYVPDRRRVQKWLKVLEAPENDLIRKEGRHVWNAQGKWTQQYLVAPYPLAYIWSASPPDHDADVRTATGNHDGEVQALAMRTFRHPDADTQSTPDADVRTAQTDLEQTNGEQTNPLDRKKRDRIESESPQEIEARRRADLARFDALAVGDAHA